jgi:branched-subunit amino acid transport protein
LASRGSLVRGSRCPLNPVHSTIILPGLTNPNDSLFISSCNLQLLADTIAIMAVLRTKNILITNITGMPALLVFQ